MRIFPIIYAAIRREIEQGQFAIQSPDPNELNLLAMVEYVALRKLSSRTRVFMAMKRECGPSQDASTRRRRRGAEGSLMEIKFGLLGAGPAGSAYVPAQIAPDGSVIPGHLDY
jgi:hypothetical protein